MNGDNLNKHFKSALRSVIAPLLIVLRKEQKETNSLLIDQMESRVEVQKTEETHPQKEIEVTNFPKEFKVSNPQEQVSVKGLKDHFVDVHKMVAGVGKAIKEAGKLLVDSIGEVKTFIQSHTFSVEVKNQKEITFPKVQGVKLSDADMQKIIKGIKQEVQKVQIENSTPGEAIPVVLTSKERRRFYDQLAQITGGTNLSNVKALLQEIVDNTANINIDIDTVNVNLDDLEALAGKNLVESYAEISGVATATETVIVSLTVPTGKTWRFKYVFAEGDQLKDTDFRVYLNSTKKWQGKISHQDRNVTADREFKAVAGDVIELRVEHQSGTLGKFSGGIQLYDLTGVA